MYKALFGEIWLSDTRQDASQDETRGRTDLSFGSLTR